MVTVLPRQSRPKASQPGQSGRGLPLHAVPREDTTAMESLMAGDLDVNAVTGTGMTPLIIASANGHLGTVRALLKRGAAVNQKRNDGFTALALAAFFGHEQVVRDLLSHGADVKAEDKSGSTAEMWADARNLRAISDLLRRIRERSLEIASLETVPVSEPILTQPSPEPSTADPDPAIASPEPVSVSEPILAQPPPQSSAVGKDNEDLAKTTIARQRTETIEAKTVAEDSNDPGFPEGSIRRVGGPKSAAVPVIEWEYRVDYVAQFSPYSALVDRLTASWKNAAVVMFVVLIFSGVVAFVAFKEIIRKPNPGPTRAGTTALPAESKQPASLPNQPVTSVPEAQTNVPDAQTKTSLDVSSGQVSLAPIQRQSSDNATSLQASHSEPTVSQDLANERAATLEAKRRGQKPKSQYSNQPVSEIAKPPHTRRRSESVGFDNEARNGSSGASGPAEIKIVSEAPPKQVRKASPAKEIQPPPTATPEASSTKRKVIQWP